MDTGLKPVSLHQAFLRKLLKSGNIKHVGLATFSNQDMHLNESIVYGSLKVVVSYLTVTSARKSINNKHV